MRILVLDSGNTSSYHVMRSLARSGQMVHLVASENTPWIRSKYCSKAIFPPPYRNQDESVFLEFLISLISKTHYDLLLFCGDTEAESIYRHHVAISKYVECFIPGPRVLAVAFNKNAAYRHAKQIGIPVPEACFPMSLQEVSDLRDTLEYPVVIKGQMGSASSNVRFISDANELLPKYQEIYDLECSLDELPSIQEHVSGDGYIAHLLFNNGKPLTICCHRKDRQYPIGGGVTSAATTVDIPDLADEALKMAISLKWHGLIKFDFMYDPKTRQYKFIEMDPRVSASIDITRAAGADQCVMLCDLLQGKVVEPVLTCNAGIRYRWLFPRDLMNAFAQPRSLMTIPTDLISRDVYFDMSLADWLPTIHMAVRFLRHYPKYFSDKKIVNTPPAKAGDF